MRSAKLLFLIVCLSVPGFVRAQTQDTERTRAIIHSYVEEHDASHLADDALFIDLSTGHETRGREAVGEMLNHIYHVAFDAHAETHSIVADGSRAVLQSTFVGKHIGEFAGTAPTGRDVRVPLVVVYDVEDDQVQKAEIYMLRSVMMEQLGAAGPTASDQ